MGEISFILQNGGSFIQIWLLVEIFNICKDQKLLKLCANIVPGCTNNDFDEKTEVFVKNFPISKSISKRREPFPNISAKASNNFR